MSRTVSEDDTMWFGTAGNSRPEEELLHALLRYSSGSSDTPVDSPGLCRGEDQVQVVQKAAEGWWAELASPSGHVGDQSWMSGPVIPVQRVIGEQWSP